MKEIPLTQGLFAIVDDEDYDFLMQWKWQACKCDKSFYAKRHSSIAPTTVSMHRVIMKAVYGQMIDHKDGDPLNNQKHNLRFCDHKGNGANRRSSYSSMSKYLGVYYFKSHKKWRARITHNKKLIHIGLFNTEENAAIAYNIYAEKYHGQFARYNAYTI